MRNLYPLSLFFLAGGSTFAEETDNSFLQASVALDRAMIPALVATREGADRDTEGAVARLAEAWPVFHLGQGEVLSKAGGWSLIQSGVTRRIEMAGKFAASDDVEMAYILLSQVREDLIRIRKALNTEYFVDLLVVFQMAMDSKFGDENGRLAELDPETLIKEISDLMDDWKAIKNTGIDAEIYGFLWKDLSALDDLLQAETEAISLLRRTAVSGNSDDLYYLAEAVRRGIFEVYLMFGAAE